MEMPARHNFHQLIITNDETHWAHVCPANSAHHFLILIPKLCDLSLVNKDQKSSNNWLVFLENVSGLRQILRILHWRRPKKCDMSYVITDLRILVQEKDIREHLNIFAEEL